jgi:chromosome segregation ATPase
MTDQARLNEIERLDRLIGEAREELHSFRAEGTAKREKSRIRLEALESSYSLLQAKLRKALEQCHSERKSIKRIQGYHGSNLPFIWNLCLDSTIEGFENDSCSHGA